MFQWTTNYQHVLPSAAAAASVTPSGSAWADSAWVELSAATDTDWVLTGAYCFTRAATADWELDVGIGAASSEVVICTFKGFVRNIATYGHGLLTPLPIPIDNIPSGSRVAIRMRKAGTNTSDWTFKICYLKYPIVGNLQMTDQPLKGLPAAAAAITLNSNTTTWTFGTWTEISASAPADLVLAGICASQPFTGVPFEIEVGVGPAASEVAVGRIAGYMSQTVVWPGVYHFPNPIDNSIDAGDRISARWRKSGTSATGIDVALVYYEKPL